MRFILRKYVDATDARSALRLDRRTPVHDVYLRDGEEPKRAPDGANIDAIGFYPPAQSEPRDHSAKRK